MGGHGGPRFRGSKGARQLVTCAGSQERDSAEADRLEPSESDLQQPPALARPHCLKALRSTKAALPAVADRGHLTFKLSPTVH